MKQIKKLTKLVALRNVLYIVLSFSFIGCVENKPKDCKTYKYTVDVCNNCFGAWFYTDSISWENGMLIAVDHYGKKRILKPLEIEEGAFEVCN